MPTFASEQKEADWWASRHGREFVKRKSAELLKEGSAAKRSRLLGRLQRMPSVQIALRLPAPDLAQARELAECKGIGYQTLLKILVHEGLRREAQIS